MSTTEAPKTTPWVFVRRSKLRFRWVWTWDSRERKVRVCRWSWESFTDCGKWLGTSLSLSLVPRLFVWKRSGRLGRRETVVLGVRVHRRPYSGGKFD